MKTTDFLKQFKIGQQLNDFIHSIQLRAIEKALEGELDDHLGCYAIPYENYPLSALQCSLSVFTNNLHNHIPVLFTFQCHGALRVIMDMDM